ncbi:hypothetical protein HF325_000181 [Metschnikowia pulcherrima]|uniref:histone deacetylase n=1 Tax=Metschnikowia pulcherrima TaxID=27326 RepID=A0A8H7LDQ7_9ASCO|nr:hypothetical protein HF325_000181 [Metschnikowia pulcherrima]
MPACERKVHLCHSTQAAAACDNLPSNIGRQSLIDSLIAAFGLHEICQLVDVVRASRKDVEAFHDQKYVAEVFRDRPEDPDDLGEKKDIKQREKFGLVYDCPPFPQLGLYTGHVVGSSICAANVLLNADDDLQNVAVNWYGGRHHALKHSASGYCYVNDIVLAILRLRIKYRRIFYLDLDLHHGDGVEEAFKFLNLVTTCSVHRHDVGFFPGTGAKSERGAYNVPTRRGLSDENFAKIIKKVLILMENVQPDVIVLQCGSDGLANDPCGEWNLTIRGLASGIMEIVNKFECTPFLILGGGGYNHTETARFCAWLTKNLVGDTTVWEDIPEHTHLDEYEQDGFRFWTPNNTKCKPGRRDENGDFSKLKLS